MSPWHLSLGQAAFCDQRNWVFLSTQQAFIKQRLWTPLLAVTKNLWDVTLPGRVASSLES